MSQKTIINLKFLLSDDKIIYIIWHSIRNYYQNTRQYENVITINLLAIKHVKNDDNSFEWLFTEIIVYKLGTLANTASLQLTS